MNTVKVCGWQRRVVMVIFIYFFKLYEAALRGTIPLFKVI